LPKNCTGLKTLTAPFPSCALHRTLATDANVGAQAAHRSVLVPSSHFPFTSARIALLISTSPSRINAMQRAHAAGLRAIHEDAAGCRDQCDVRARESRRAARRRSASMTPESSHAAAACTATPAGLSITKQSRVLVHRCARSALLHHRRRRAARRRVRPEPYGRHTHDVASPATACRFGALAVTRATSPFANHAEIVRLGDVLEDSAEKLSSRWTRSRARLPSLVGLWVRLHRGGDGVSRRASADRGFVTSCFH
jgi:hypothetical protein